MTRHVAFLRGVGPARKAPGDDLRHCLTAAGYTDVTPVLATGNVVFGLGRKRKPPAPADIEAVLADHFGYAIPAILRSEKDIAAMFDAGHFRDVDAKQRTRFVCMLGEETKRAPASLDLPPKLGFQMVGHGPRDLFFVRDEPDGGTPEIMVWLDRTFGKAITTRNWNTMERVARILGIATA